MLTESLKKLVFLIFSPDGESHEERMARYKKAVKRKQCEREFEKAMRTPGKVVEMDDFYFLKSGLVDKLKVEQQRRKLLEEFDKRGLQPNSSITMPHMLEYTNEELKTLMAREQLKIQRKFSV